MRPSTHVARTTYQPYYQHHVHGTAAELHGCCAAPPGYRACTGALVLVNMLTARLGRDYSAEAPRARGLRALFGLAHHVGTRSEKQRSARDWGINSSSSVTRTPKKGSATPRRQKAYECAYMYCVSSFFRFLRPKRHTHTTVAVRYSWQNRTREDHVERVIHLSLTHYLGDGRRPALLRLRTHAAWGCMLQFFSCTAAPRAAPGCQSPQPQPLSRHSRTPVPWPQGRQWEKGPGCPAGDCQ